MDRSEIIYLLTPIYQKDTYGIPRKVREERRQVYAQKDSITATEFFNGGKNGINPAFRFRIFVGDYNDEDVLEYNGKPYDIYRTFEDRGDIIELYCERRAGVHG